MRARLRDKAATQDLHGTPARQVNGPVAGVMALQRAAGNRAVRAVLARQSAIDGAIRTADRRMTIHRDRASADATPGDKRRTEIGEYWKWYREKLFLETLKSVHESQRGVPLSYDRFPVTKTDAVTGARRKDTPWRHTSQRQSFAGSGERQGSFCLGTTRGIAVRKTFGLGKPTYSRVLTDLTAKAEAAKKDGAEADEAAALISRIVSHLHDPGSLEQFNQDLESRYGIANVSFKAAARREAFDALKAGASVLADLEGGWHWVMVSRSPQGNLWKNDPLQAGGSGVQQISANELGSRFEIIVDAATGKPITPADAASHEKTAP
jgi:hypothetical protein